MNVVRVAANVQVGEMRKGTGHGKLRVDMLKDDMKNFQSVMGRQ